MGETDTRWQRVVVVGCSCAGKTRFARDLAGLLGIPHIEIDAIYWLPEWGSRPREEFRALMEEEVARRRWVVEGNYSQVRDIVWGRATAVVWLNYSFPLVFARALGRTVRRVALRERLFGGNRETFRSAFLSTESILWWVLTNRLLRTSAERRCR